jgi:hypothetical protein
MWILHLIVSAAMFLCLIVASIVMVPISIITWKWDGPYSELWLGISEIYDSYFKED